MNEAMLITGGGRGIGAETARLGALQGYAVAIGYVQDAQEADALVGEIRASGGTALAVQADVSREVDVERLFAAVDRELGPLTVLVDNAGVVDRMMRVDEMQGARLERRERRQPGPCRAGRPEFADAPRRLGHRSGPRDPLARFRRRFVLYRDGPGRGRWPLSLVAKRRRGEPTLASVSR